MVMPCVVAKLLGSGAQFSMFKNWPCHLKIGLK